MNRKRVEGPWAKVLQAPDRNHHDKLIEELRANRDARNGRPYRSAYSKACLAGLAGR